MTEPRSVSDRPRDLPPREQALWDARAAGRFGRSAPNYMTA